jgi:hypothetical protein
MSMLGLKLALFIIKREMDKNPELLLEWHKEIAGIAYESATDVCDIMAHHRLRKRADILASEFLRIKFGVYSLNALQEEQNKFKDKGGTKK